MVTRKDLELDRHMQAILTSGRNSISHSSLSRIDPLSTYHSRRAGCRPAEYLAAVGSACWTMPTPTSTLGAVPPLVVAQGHFELQIFHVLWSLRD